MRLKVAFITPITRGLKDNRFRSGCNAQLRVAFITPITRGLKASVSAVIDESLIFVAFITPITRGLKGSGVTPNSCATVSCCIHNPDNKGTESCNKEYSYYVLDTVAFITPITRGLKVNTAPNETAIAVLVAFITPITRGLKVIAKEKRICSTSESCIHNPDNKGTESQHPGYRCLRPVLLHS